jgi:hypothetical protein
MGCNLLMIDIWLDYFAIVAVPTTLDAFVEVLERFDAAEQDYLCKSEISSWLIASFGYPF